MRGGSVPSGSQTDVYATLIEDFNGRGVQTILDTTVDALSIAITGRPH